MDPVSVIIIDEFSIIEGLLMADFKQRCHEGKADNFQSFTTRAQSYIAFFLSNR